MTVMEFCEKYGIDYNVVYKASNTIRSLTYGYRGRLYDEKELKEAVVEHIKNRRERAYREVNRTEAMLKKLQ